MNESGGLYTIGNDNEGEDFTLRVNDSSTSFRTQLFSDADFDFTVDFETVGEWRHYVLMHDENETSVYIDGVKIASLNRNLDTKDNNTLRLGQWLDRDEPAQAYFDEFIVYDRALTEQEINILYDKGNSLL